MLNYIEKFLVRRLKVSSSRALELIFEKKVFVNNKIASVHQQISEKDEIRVEDNILQSAKKLLYLAFYKPKGIECTLNLSIPNNLNSVLAIKEGLFPLGRLDKESEGLLVLTNDGKIYNNVTHSDSFKEKEYEVTVNNPLTVKFLSELEKGMVILGRTTRPAIVWKLNDFQFKIILTQGLNRQIRRMCYKHNYNVISLKRTRIVQIQLGSLMPGEIRELFLEEIESLKNKKTVA